MRSHLLVALTAVVSLAHASWASAQSVPVLGFVANENANPARLAIFKKALADLSYVEGNTVRLEYRLAKLDKDYPMYSWP